MTAELLADPTPSLLLSAAMRDGSAAAHRDAESSPFVAELIEGRLAPTAYADLLLRLRRVYAAIEDAVRADAGDPRVAAVHDPVLERRAAIDADLLYWAPDADPDAVESPATDAYVDRIATARKWGGLLAAHHYTRYLGDLSGGQAIARALTRTYGADAAVAFYDFAITKPKLYKDAYRARLDALALDATDTDRVVDEVRAAFALNRGLFTELGRRLDHYRVA